MSTATMAVSAVQKSGRIASLDGWRGIAILLVLVDHTQAAFLGRYARTWTQTGQHGVTLFFVLSGFLITTKLMEGQNLRTFYIRRLFRLMPAAWLYLLFLGALHITTRRDALSCIFFFRNYGDTTLATGHFWSLSIEEQFYLVWPGLLLLAGSKRARWIALSGATLCALYRLIEWNHYDRIWMSFRTEVRIDALLIGCLLALVFPHVKAGCVKLVIPALALFAFCILRYHWLPPLYEDIAIAVLLGASAADSRSLLARITSLQPLPWLGIVSYSVYVWQQVFFENRGFPTTLTMICIMPVFALGSYYLIEKPCIRLGHRLSQPHHHVELAAHR